MRYATVLAGVAMVNLWGLPADAARGEQPSAVDAPAVATPALAARPDALALQMRNDRARLLYLLGKRQCAHARYVEGLKSLQDAYAVERLPDLLFEMAACQGKAGAMQRAFELHRRYVDSFRDPVKRLVAAARFGAIMQQVRDAAKTKDRPMAKAPLAPPSAAPTPAR